MLVLLPEIALDAAQCSTGSRRRFGAVPAEWHSDVPPPARRDTWRAVADGGARIVVGARSALFLPFPELGLIVVDEEHDHSYKQEDGVCYQARDMAVLRASLAKIPIVLVSATPSLETVINVSRGRYRRVALPRRHAEAALPEMSLVDMRQEICEPGRFLSPPLVAALRRRWKPGSRLSFLNRRGWFCWCTSSVTYAQSMAGTMGCRWLVCVGGRPRLRCGTIAAVVVENAPLLVRPLNARACSN